MAAQTTAQQFHPTLARRILQGNAIFSGISGAIFLVGASPLSAFLGWPTPIVLLIVGAVILLYAGLLFLTILRQRMNRQLVVSVAILDSSWVAGSLFLLFAPFVPLTGAGKWAIALITFIVADFAIVEFYAARQPK